MKAGRRRRGRIEARAILMATVLTAGGCFDFHMEGPEDAPSPPLPRIASVTVEYEQPAECRNVPSRCSDRVVFYGSWMRPGQELLLEGVPGGFIWRGTLSGVPVNYPPAGAPYTVHVFDPYLVGAPTRGAAGRRLVVGGESLTAVEDLGTGAERAQVYVDDNGFGHNPI